VISSYYYTPEGTLKQNLSEDEMRAIVKSKQGLLWVDLFRPGPDELFMLDEVFAFHPLAIEDCQHISRMPKVDDYGSHLFVVFLAPNPKCHSFSVPKPGDKPVRMSASAPAPSKEIDVPHPEEEEPLHEIDLFLGVNFVVTYHVAPLPFMQLIADRAKREPKRIMGRASSFLAHDILDAAVDQFFVMVETIQVEVEELEENITSRGLQPMLTQLLRLKGRLLGLRRQIGDHREMLSHLIRGNYEVMHPKSIIYYRDVLDHLNRIEDDLDVCRESLDSTRDAYLALTDVRTNETLKFFTIVFTISIPITIMTGWFGMNFQNLPWIGEEWGWWVATLIMCGSSLGLYLWFRFKKLI